MSGGAGDLTGIGRKSRDRALVHRPTVEYAIWR